MNQEYLSSTIIDIIDESPNVKRFFLKISEIDSYDFEAGQFAIISFPEIQHKFPYRSYSIASAPDGTNVIELCIVLKKDGAATPTLFQAKGIGDKILVTKPLGRFVLPEVIEHDVCFICTGTGVAPFRSMILSKFKDVDESINFYVIFGNRKQEDILYRKEFEDLSLEYKNFHFYPVLSREEWDGEQGYVHPIYKRLFQDNRETLFYICGWSKMVKEAKNELKAMGYSRKQIKFELYD